VQGLPDDIVLDQDLQSALELLTGDKAEWPYAALQLRKCREQYHLARNQKPLRAKDLAKRQIKIANLCEKLADYLENERPLKGISSKSLRRMAREARTKARRYQDRGGWPLEYQARGSPKERFINGVLVLWIYFGNHLAVTEDSELYQFAEHCLRWAENGVEPRGVHRLLRSAVPFLRLVPETGVEFPPVVKAMYAAAGATMKEHETLPPVPESVLRKAGFKRACRLAISPEMRKASRRATKAIADHYWKLS
jgi:hypothetical protein